LFSSASPQKSANSEEGGDDAQEYVPDAHFEPLVKLSGDVDLKTGEEDEEVLFCQRSRLYRFDASSSQWKERGVGEMKILKNPQTCMSIWVATSTLE
jgi:E3 SUMO-protein ligase RanBP2